MTIDAKVENILKPLKQGGVDLTIYTSDSDHRPAREGDILVYQHDVYVEVMPRNPRHYLVPEHFPDPSCKSTTTQSGIGYQHRHDITVPGTTTQFEVYAKRQERSTDNLVGAPESAYSRLRAKTYNLLQRLMK